MRVYVAATRQNDGKTIISLGLLKAFQKAGKKIGYLKPVGQQYRLIDGVKIDKDVVLMRDIFDLKDPLPSMSPVAVPRGFTERYILSGGRDSLVDQITRGYEDVGTNKDFVLVEGTGHAGVGSVFDMSNCDVANLLDVKVILVSVGGIGRPIDMIMLNKAVFDRKNVEVLGVIINKVKPSKYDKVNRLVREGLKRQGIEVFGVIPLDDVLSSPSIAELFEDLDGEVLAGCPGSLRRFVRRFGIGDRRPHDVLEHFIDNTLMVIPGEREDLAMTALSSYEENTSRPSAVSGIIFTCGIRPHEKILELLEKRGMPVLLVEEDSFAVATRINDLIFKLRPEDVEKMALVENLIDQYVDIDRIASLL